MTVLEKRYLKRDKSGKVVETPDQMFRRVAEFITQDDSEYTEKFYEIMDNLEFLPNSPTMMNAGNLDGTLSACFVIPIDDSMESILGSAKIAGMVLKYGGGCGFSFSGLRPKNAPIKSTHKHACGPVQVIRHYNSVSELITQGGMRRGANMGVCRVDHPDILEFITCKDKEGDIDNFNLSVAITDDFMQALRDEEDYELNNPQTGKVCGTLNAKYVFDLIVKHAHKNGEPGILFIDSANKDNPTPHLGDYEATNPCGEAWLLPFESCNLGSINVAKFVEDGVFNYKRLKQVTQLATRFLDNVIESNRFPIKEIEENTLRTRKLGLGIMGFADTLVQMGIPYASARACQVAKKIMRTVNDIAFKTSCDLADERGVFPAWAGSVFEEDDVKIRNSVRTVLAPTGTLSLLSDCSPGIEPLFGLHYTRDILDGETLHVFNPGLELLREHLDEGGYAELLEHVREHGSIQKFTALPAKIRKIYLTANEIDPEWHIKMQAAFQEYTDNAVSKTVNLPNDATPDDIAEIIEQAYAMDCKGVTVYRDGSRKIQVVNVGEKAEDERNELRVVPRERNGTATGITDKHKAGSCGKIYVTANSDEDGPLELFPYNSGGGCPPLFEVIGRLSSNMLRAGWPPEEIIKILRKGHNCTACIADPETSIRHCPDAMGLTLAKLVNAEAPRELNPVENHKPQYDVPKCHCGGVLLYNGKCWTCNVCGQSKCTG